MARRPVIWLTGFALVSGPAHAVPELATGANATLPAPAISPDREAPPDGTADATPSPPPASAPIVAPPRDPDCVPESPAETIAMTTAPRVFNVLTGGARPNSRLILRIDNRTTVTVTVNADPVTPGFCPAVAAPGPAEPEPGLTPVYAPPAAPDAAAGGIFEVPFWAGQWANRLAGGVRASGGSGPGGQGAGGQGAGGGGRGGDGSGGSGEHGGGQHGGGGGQHGGGSDQTPAWEPSTLAMLASGLLALAFLARRRR